MIGVYPVTRHHHAESRYWVRVTDDFVKQFELSLTQPDDLLLVETNPECFDLTSPIHVYVQPGRLDPILIEMHTDNVQSATTKQRNPRGVRLQKRLKTAGQKAGPAVQQQTDRANIVGTVVLLNRNLGTAS